MNIKLKKSSKLKSGSQIKITGSKSESNRLLLLKALFPELTILNLSNSDDSQVMQKALEDSTSPIIDIHHAGTAMRFLTAFFATQENRKVTITGSLRMQERPIQILVDALRDLGADIQYLKNEGYPPLQISGKCLEKNSVELAANISSQYISALLLIAPKLKNGLQLKLKGKITSVPYIKMTLALLEQIGVETHFDNNILEIKPQNQNLKTKTLIVESDWSSASYYYSIVALSALGTEIELSSYKETSLQGDSVLASIYKSFGVTTTFKNNSIVLYKNETIDSNILVELDLANAPDIAQTIAITCLGLQIPCKLSGLHTLKIKETDRLVALKTEIEKFGATVEITDNSLEISKFNPLKSKVKIATYNDHRMAMAFAPLALKKTFTVNEAEVVSKSYPEFWKDLKSIGFQLKK
ncbi:MAG: 3-phosphoshikimate 1-carboxyvinyltransferase [Flavobacteriaceae bacterium]|nr:3-phosphoshikimate 1-carboxyvinyltransferase [Flavobacteriaceae bacterium]